MGECRKMCPGKYSNSGNCCPMTNLDSILKSREITLQTKVCLVKVMILPVVIYGCELSIKKAEH